MTVARLAGTVMKSQIIEHLGQAEILLPALIAAGLKANDRAKARLSVLQSAGRHARQPTARFDLAAECRAAGLDPIAMETLANGASLASDGRIAIPGATALVTAVFDDIATMARAVEAGSPAEGTPLQGRLAALRQASALRSADTLDPAELADLTGLTGRNGESVHRLIMDLHKGLNRLSAAHCEEVVAGAHVYGLLPSDRPAVEAFMRGVQSTIRLKFDHPGLATTAARSGTRLTIQNDIGETDAHVIVIAVEADAVTITYTDVHLARAKFFSRLFASFAIAWSGLDRKTADSLGDDGAFYLITGRYTFDGAAARDAFLEGVGAALVFLIDWNKARKVLRNWVSKGDAIGVLDWAARHRIGHRAFLELGGGELVAAAVHHAAPTRIGFGERLDHALGPAAAADFLKAVLRISLEALSEGGSTRLARDRIEAELVRHLDRVDSSLLAIVVRQAGLARDIAAAVAHALGEQQARRAFDRAGLADGARRIEEKADRIALEARGEIARLDADRVIERLVNRMEEAIDELEQAAFAGSLMPSDIAPALLEPLVALCTAAIDGAEAAASGTVAAASVPDGQRSDSEDALAAVGRLIAVEHRADAAERAVMTLVLQGAFDLKTALAALELARALERATDRLAGFGHLLRERVIADLAS